MKKQIMICLVALIVPQALLASGRCKRSKSSSCKRQGPMQGHHQIQQDFIAIQQRVGINPSPSTINSMKKNHGKQGTQAEFNQVRSTLNNLLNQEVLDIAKIRANIQQLNKLNPARWPDGKAYEQTYMKMVEMGWQTTEPLT